MTNISDQDQREKIRNNLETNFLVEAAAGTGKTHSLTSRMVNLLKIGACRADTLVAVTFTRKAAAELRERFRLELEKAHGSASGKDATNISNALENVEKCFVGTIHSFCARLLRERPVEAGVDIGFQEIEEEEDDDLKAMAWRNFVAELYETNAPSLSEMESLGIEIGWLEEPFSMFCGYPDVELWPADQVASPQLASAMPRIEAFMEHMEICANDLPDQCGTDEMISEMKEIARAWRQAPRNDEPKVYDILAKITQLPRKVYRKKFWKATTHEPDVELSNIVEFCRDHAEPLCKEWSAYKYSKILPVIREAVNSYERLKKKQAKLNYQDLLLNASKLLKSNPKIRSFFQKRFTHILVDEFQDTDPIQAEVLMFLTASNPNETDWRKCLPKPGRLFVVGDPKQSIYRFRRADIVTYNQVKEIIIQNGGEVINLSVNFRTEAPIIEWVNAGFENSFNMLSKEMSPDYVPLVASRAASGDAYFQPIQQLQIPKDYKNVEMRTEFEADFIAKIIRQACDSGSEIVKSGKKGAKTSINPGDFLIVTFRKDRLGDYGHKLREYGLPYQITGGDSLNGAMEIALLYRYLKAVLEPNEPTALVAVLVSDLFGLSDRDLYEFVSNGGRFSFLSDIPASMSGSSRSRFQTVFNILKKHAEFLQKFPLPAALELIIHDLGLYALSSLDRDNGSDAGALTKAVELIRIFVRDAWTPTEAVEYLKALIDKTHKYDSLPVRPHKSSQVRVMNLHKVKGLEAPIVFLADPAGNSHHPPTMHVDRSKDIAEGYLKIDLSDAFQKKSATFIKVKQTTVPATPSNWDKLSARETQFAEAESLRLLYVAATRAGSSLTISQCGHNPESKDADPLTAANKKNPWGYFLDCPPNICLLNQGAPAPISQKGICIDVADLTSRFASFTERKVRCLKPGYAVTSAKTSTSAQTFSSTQKSMPQGLQWGSAVHSLLQALMVDSGADLTALAEFALEEYELEGHAPGDLISTVQTVMASDIWSRANTAKTRYVEIPYQDLEIRDGLNTIVRGVIDLVFKETSGWVVVDYKTDRVSRDNLAKLCKSYEHQVSAYRRAWGKITGENVTEAGFFFTHLNEFHAINV